MTGSGDGLDQINGGDDSDTWLGGTGTDFFFVSGTTGNLDNLTSIENIDGGAGYDRIFGSTGDDTINFSSGNPTLANIEEIDGGSGADTITASTSIAASYRGSAGADTFVVTTTSADTSILDFNDSGNDVIDLTSFGFGDIADVFDLATENGGNVTIDLTNASSQAPAVNGTGDIILVGTTLASLSVNDFII